MKTHHFLAGVAALTLACVALAARADDYQLLRNKAELLVGQAKELHQESFRRGSEVSGVAYQYYFGLMQAAGTNLLGRARSPSVEKRLRAYCELVGKDYEAYTKVDAALEMASATGKLRGNAGTRHRAKRLINAERLRDKELSAAIERWEKFVKSL